MNLINKYLFQYFRKKFLSRRTKLTKFSRSDEKYSTLRVKPAKFLKVYLVHQKKIFSKNENDSSIFINRLDELKQNELILFLNIKEALLYSYCFDGQVSLFKAYVPENAVESYIHTKHCQISDFNLMLDSSCLTTSLIHGCYPDIGKMDCYINNPNFEAHLTN